MDVSRVRGGRADRRDGVLGEVSAYPSFVAALLLAFTALALAYNAVVPVFEGADESSHYFVAQSIARTGRLPVQRAATADRGPWEQEGSQPPLYYALAAPLVRLAGADLDGEALRYNHQNSMGRPAVAGNENRFVHDPALEGWPWRGYALAVHLGRLLSTLLGLITLLALASVFRRVFPGRPWLAAAALALVALNPQFIHLAATLTNDNAMNAVAAVALALLLRLIEADGDGDLNGHDDAIDGGDADSSVDVAVDGDRDADADAAGDHPAGAPPSAATRRARRRGDAVVLAGALAVAVGLAPLAKITGLSLAAFVVAVLLWSAWRRRAQGGPDAAAAVRRAVATAAAVILACLVLSGWWYVRNIRLYGSLTGLNIMLPPELRRDWNLARFLHGLPGELNGLWRSSWGLFGWFTILLPTWVYRAIDAAAIAAIAGTLGSAVRRFAPRPNRSLTLLILWWLIAFASLLRWMMIAKGAHGRLLFPAIAAPAALFVLGWRALPPTRRVTDRALARTVAAAMATLSVGALVGVIRPAYARPGTIDAAALPGDAVPIGVVFDGAVELVAMTAPARVVEGATADVTMYWRVRRPVSRDGFVALRFDQEIGATRDGVPPTTASSAPDLSYPGAGTTPFAMLPPGDRLVVDRRRVVAPRLATAPDWDGYRPSVLARLAVDVYDMGARASWPSAAAGPGGTDAAAVDIALDAAPQQSDRDERLAAARAGPVARFGDAIDLDVRAFGDGGPPTVPPLPIALVRSAPAVTGTLDLVWRARATPSQDYQMFIHLVDLGTGEVTAMDGPVARYARYPTSRWRAGDRIPFHLDWTAPTAAKPGDRFALRIGLYSLAAGTPRLAAVDAAGQRWPDDAVTVYEITVR
ncbi:MAG: hypothetical protein ABI780_08975 [Ardenticatenales bacterium]